MAAAEACAEVAPGSTLPPAGGKVTPSGAVISALERKVEELEREKLVLQEKTARCGTVARDYDATFRTAFEFLSKACYIWKKWDV
ncbi:MAG: hypothetical protein U0995_00735 [Erythrobacter sp.]|nr:hypothetical protein [Erythrobacter sp.]